MNRNRLTREQQIAQRAGKVVKEGPFSILLGVQNGWQSYTLVVGDVQVKTWGSNPGVEYCREALVEAMIGGEVVKEQAIELLLQVSTKPRFNTA